MGRPWAGRVGIALAAVVPLLAVPAVTAFGGPARSGHLAAAPAAASDWPEFHRDASLGGVASNSPISTANAGTLGVRWQTYLEAPALSSPVVAYDAALGRSLVYVGTEHGDLVATDAATGAIVWSRWLGSPLRATPLVSGGDVWIGTTDSPRIVKLDAATGAVLCSTPAPATIEGSPVAATPPGGVATVYFGTYGPTVAIDEATCATEWSFSGYAAPAGSWDPLSIGTGPSGRVLVLLGTADPDSRVYALDALTGREVWSFAVTDPAPKVFDIGAGIPVSPPGANGFADGAAYVACKWGIVYALDLATGHVLWRTSLRGPGGTPDLVSTAALEGGRLVLGDPHGLVELDASTGDVLWTSPDPTRSRIVSSPAVAGSTDPVVLAGDLAGNLDAFSLASGTVLATLPTGSYLASSPAVSNDNVLVSSTTGFLTDFVLDGASPGTPPSATIGRVSRVRPWSSGLLLTGEATGTAGVAAVRVAVQSSGANGPWWDGRTRRFVPGPFDNQAALGTPGATTTTWQLDLPLPRRGGSYQVVAEAVAASGVVQPQPASVFFVVRPAPTNPRVQLGTTVAPRGSVVVARGSGFGDGRRVVLSMLGSRLATTTSSSSGTIGPVSFRVPATAAFGPGTLVVTATGSGRSVAVPITVANSWSQLGGGAAHSGYEADDETFFDHVTPGDGIYLTPAWRRSMAAPVVTSPAVVGDVVYAGDLAGQVVAFSLRHGGRIWTWSSPLCTAVVGSVAVDPVEGRVVVGCANGTVAALSSTTGRLEWARSPGPVAGAPILALGRVYVATTTGVVVALEETLGTTLWSHDVGGPVAAAPAVDLVAGILVVAKEAGRLVGLSAAEGGVLWATSTNGEVTTAPEIAGGVVTVATGDAVVAVAEMTGTLRWARSLGALVSASPVAVNVVGTAPPDVGAGTATGELVMLSSDGAVVWNLSTGPSPIVGLASARLMVVATSAAGVVGSAFTWGQWVWSSAAGTSASAGPAVVDGTVLASAATPSGGSVTAYTTWGQPPS